MSSRVFLVIAACAAALVPSNGFADEESARRQFFESKVRPLLVEKCQGCHSSEDPQSKFTAESLAGLLRGGLRGPAIIPGKPDESLLISAVKHGEILKMPPKEKLPVAEIADLVKWVEEGAYWPDANPTIAADAASTSDEPEFTSEQRAFWAFRKPVSPDIPEAVRPGDFHSPIDRFLDVKLAASRYAPAAPATKRVLLRRATFDLTGLPPTPNDLDEFLADESPDAMERLIDRLLASPRYGEKWGRHWLDVARYGDSNGLDENLAFAHAFRYRDYVVSSFNMDLPYDEFVRAQIAGDRLNASNTHAANGNLVATGFLALGPKMLAEDDPVKMQMDIIDEQVDTLGKAFLGMTFGCARCHHHKFDPISQHDYYALAGIFKSTKTMDTFSVVARWQERPLGTPDELERLARQTELIAAAESRIQSLVAATNQEILTETRRHLGDYLLAAVQYEHRDRRLALRQPLGNRPDALHQPGVIVIEAEDYVRGNVIRDTTNYGKEIGVLVNRGETPNFAEYDIDLPQAGSYQIELRYAAESSRPCRLFANGKELSADAAAKVTGGWYPPHQAWHIEGVFDLPSGKATLRLEQPTFFPHIDKLLLAPCTEETTPANFVRLDENYTPQPFFIERFRKSLSHSPVEEPDPLACWREFVNRDQHSLSEETRAQWKEAAGEIQRHVERIMAERSADDPLHKLLFSADGPISIPKDQEVGYSPEVVAELAKLRNDKSELEAALPKLPEAMSVSDQAPEDVRIHIRGSHLTLGETVPRRFPRILGGGDQAIGSQGSGRLELADWITRPDHPLTARVIVNRIWQWHFGEGIVRSVDNFGLLGEPPSHPELLDWLATEFPRREWSIKRMHRELMRSAAYRRSGTVEESQRQTDPENRLLSRFSRRRLEVEELRDALLAAAGTLDDRMSGSQLATPNRQYVTSTANVNPDMYRVNRRSIYLPVVRSALYDVFQAFDFADPNVSSGRRDSTTVAAQALFLMNSEFVSRQMQAWGAALASDGELNDAERIREIYCRALGREPSADEVARILRYVTQETAESNDEREDRARVWQSVCRAVVSMNEFVFVE